MATQYKLLGFDRQWARDRRTDDVVAAAIHAIASASRTIDDIWMDPTPAEYDTILMAVQDYVANGAYDAADEYNWGEHTFQV